MSFKYFPLTPYQVNKRKDAWEGLSHRRAFGRAAVVVYNRSDEDEISNTFIPEEEIPLVSLARSMPEWDKEIRKQVRALHVASLSKYQDDSFPALGIPRTVHGQSQTLAEIFGCRLIPQESEQDLFFPVPWIETASDVDRINLKPVEKCLYGKAIEFAKYAHEATNGELSIRNPVMTGPIDTANYILGTMRLMEWIYEEPEALHRLIEKITNVLIDIIKKLQAASGGKLCPDCSSCLPYGFALCSEVRHLISTEVYNEFESPYLRKIGRECGSYMFHSCGTWERMLEIDTADPNLMLINFQSKEMDLEKVYEITRGNLSLGIGISVSLAEKYLWPDDASFFRHLMTVFPEPVPIEFGIKDIEGYLAVQTEMKGGTSGMFRWKPGLS